MAANVLTSAMTHKLYAVALLQSKMHSIVATLERKDNVVPRSVPIVAGGRIGATWYGKSCKASNKLLACLNKLFQAALSNKHQACDLTT